MVDRRQALLAPGAGKEGLPRADRARWTSSVARMEHQASLTPVVAESAETVGAVSSELVGLVFSSLVLETGCQDLVMDLVVAEPLQPRLQALRVEMARLVS